VTVGLHLYGVVAADADLPRGLVGRADAEVRTVSDERLAVLVSDVDEQARVGRADLLAHAHALEAVAEDCTVIPVQFGVLIPDDETVRRELLGARGDRTAALLGAFEGLVQLTVTARYDNEETALREVVRRDPTLRGNPAGDVQSKMRLGEAVAAALEELRAEDADVVVQRLSPHARAVAFNDVRDAYTATSMALLVDRKERAGLDRAVADLRRELGSRLTLRYVGPQPPYAFLESVETEVSAWG
jgi:hypothetical protein